MRNSKMHDITIGASIARSVDLIEWERLLADPAAPILARLEAAESALRHAVCPHCHSRDRVTSGVECHHEFHAAKDAT